MAHTTISLFEECKNVAKKLKREKVNFNKSLSKLLAKTDSVSLDDASKFGPPEEVGSSKCEKAVVELRRVMSCGKLLVRQWTDKQWWKTVISSSDSASLQAKVVLHLKEFFACVKVLRVIANGNQNLLFDHRNALLSEVRDLELSMSTVESDVEEACYTDGGIETYLSLGGEQLQGKLDPVVGRQAQIERVTQILGRRSKNNPCLIGEPGVGKTAIAEGLAQRIASGDVPETIKGKKVITLDLGLLVAGTKYRGEFEERLKKLTEEIKQADDIILVIDEVHTLIGAGAAEGAIDAANILKPALSRGELQCIGATTLDEYGKHIEKDPALERRFQPVLVAEPSVDETIEILKGLRERYEIHHKLRYTDEALVAAAQLSYQYISDRFLPDKAIDLIDEAGSRVRLRHAQLPEEARELDKELRGITKEKNEAVQKGKEKLKAETEAGDTGPVVEESDIQHIVSAWTGIPVEKASTDESDRLLKMEETLHQRIIGQDEAVKAISRAIRRARVGLKNPNRPIASFIWSGPTGVGKSELAKALASYYFGSQEAMIRLDMSEFMERRTVSKLIGSPPGHVGYSEGGQLTEAVRRRPYTVVLFDEIEKAHPDVFNMMLQILEDGRLTDSKGRTVDFKNTLLIMTSNVGSSVIEKGGGGIGFQLDYGEKDSSYNRIKSLVNEELKQYFRPEFLNRLDEIIVFRQLTKLEVKEIADIMLKEVFERLKKKEINLQ
ncbi:unnamed protein product, partial [Sphagnum compactum]